MTTKDKKDKIKKRVTGMLWTSIKHIEDELIDKAMNSGAIDIDGWEEKNNHMILPKIILKACLESEAEQYSAKGTSFEKMINKEVTNLKIFL